MSELSMQDAATPAIYEATTFEEWREIRAATEPFFNSVYDQVELHLVGAETILDVAGGDGHTLDVLSDNLRAGLVTVDFDGEALDRLRERYPSSKTVEADARRMPFDDESFDAAISITGFDGFRDTTGMVTEIERVLKPGGVFVFFRDMPYALQGFVTALRQDMPDRAREQFIVAPVINEASGAIDQFAFLPKRLIALLHVQPNNLAGKMALDAVSPYIGEDWQDRIYGNTLETGTIAKRFTRLMTELNILFGGPGGVVPDGIIPVAEPAAPIVERIQLARFRHSGLQVTKELVKVDYQSEEPIRVTGRPVKELYVDELANLQIRPFGKADLTPQSATRVHGRAPLYVARKN